jgi:ABC-type Fe3+-hydroxamate transport system substrate-binding protein
MRTLTDGTGRTVQVPESPQRVISLCPSQSATLAALGIGPRLAGITRFCVYPEDMWKQTPRVGGTKRIQLDKIHAINPDLIICQKEENTIEIVETLSAFYPVFVTDVETLEESYAMTETLGMLTGTEAEAAHINQKVKASLQKIEPLNAIDTAYLIWKDPYMASGRANFVDEILQLCGMNNVLSGFPDRYPKVSEQQLVLAEPRLLLLSSEPYPFAEKHIADLQALLPNTLIQLVDGMYFSWYGERMIQAGIYLSELTQKLKSQL